MIRINYWYRWPFWAFNFVDFFVISLNFVDLFWDFTKFCWFFWASVKGLDSNQIMTQAAVSRRLESTQLMTQMAFQELTLNKLMIQMDSPGIDSDWLMTRSAFPFFWFKSTYDSSEKHLIRSRLMIRLWVMPTSAHWTRNIWVSSEQTSFQVIRNQHQLL